MDFFHGSTVANIHTLIPNKGPETNMPIPCVYLTTSRHLALHYIWDSKRCPIKMPMLDIRENDLLVFQEMFPRALEYFYKGLKGYIYHCTGEYKLSKQVGVATCAISEEPVPISDFEIIDDVYDEIIAYEKKGLFIYDKYESLSPHRYELIRKTILKLIDYYKLLDNENSDLSLFFIQKFPQYWEEAIHKKLKENALLGI